MNALVNPRLYVPRFDDARIGGKGPVDLWVGRTLDGSANLEVMAHRDPTARTVEVFHVMVLRRSTYQRATAVVAERKRRARG